MTHNGNRTVGTRPVYYYSAAKRRAEQLGLVWDENLLKTSAEPVFHRAELTQKQVDEVLNLHIEILNYLWTPTNYSRLDCLSAALFWLSGIFRVKRHVRR